jgi:heme oxygenase
MNPKSQIAAHAILRTRTAAAHEAIDAAFSQFNLGNRASYIQFLRVHGRVVPAIEEALKAAVHLPAWQARTAFLMRDLGAFDIRVPKPMTIAGTLSAGEMLGLLYVLEGSRLGSRLLLRRVGRGFSAHYLSSVHEPGEWSAFSKALNERGEVEGASWLEGVVAGAKYGFHLFQLAAEHSPSIRFESSATG